MSKGERPRIIPVSEIRKSVTKNAWQRYRGPLGGVGWMNIITGEVRYDTADPNRSPREGAPNQNRGSPPGDTGRTDPEEWRGQRDRQAASRAARHLHDDGVESNDVASAAARALSGIEAETLLERTETRLGSITPRHVAAAAVAEAMQTGDQLTIEATIAAVHDAVVPTEEHESIGGQYGLYDDEKPTVDTDGFTRPTLVANSATQFFTSLRKDGEWVQYEGPRGGTGWQNTATNEVVYGEEQPGSSGSEQATVPFQPREGVPDNLDPGKAERVVPFNEEFGSRGISADSMWVAEFADGGRAFITNLNPERGAAENDLDGERAMAGYEFLSALETDAMRLPAHVHVPGDYFAVEGAKGVPASDPSAQVDRETVVQTAAANLLAGNIDFHENNVFVHDGVMTPIDLDLSADPLTFFPDINRQAMRNVIRTGGFLGAVEEGSVDEYTNDVVRAAENLAESNEMQAAVEAVSDGEHGQAIRANVAAAKRGKFLRTYKETKSWWERLLGKDWVPYEGPQGGEGWRNTATDEVRYTEDKPTNGASSDTGISIDPESWDAANFEAEANRLPADGWETTESFGDISPGDYLILDHVDAGRIVCRAIGFEDGELRFVSGSGWTHETDAEQFEWEGFELHQHQSPLDGGADADEVPEEDGRSPIQRALADNRMAIEAVIEAVDFDAVEEMDTRWDEPLKRLGDGEAVGVRRAIREQVSDKDAVSTFWGSMRGMKQTASGRDASYIQALAKETFGIEGDVRNPERYEDYEFSASEKKTMILYAAVSQELLRRTYGEDVSLYRGLSEHGAASFCEAYFTDPLSEQYEISEASVANYTPLKEVGTSFGHGGGLRVEQRGVENVINANDMLRGYYRSAPGQDEGEVWMPGGNQPINASDIHIGRYTPEGEFHREPAYLGDFQAPIEELGKPALRNFRSHFRAFTNKWDRDKPVPPTVAENARKFLDRHDEVFGESKPGKDLRQRFDSIIEDVGVADVAEKDLPVIDLTADSEADWLRHGREKMADFEDEADATTGSGSSAPDDATNVDPNVRSKHGTNAPDVGQVAGHVAGDWPADSHDDGTTKDALASRLADLARAQVTKDDDRERGYEQRLIEVHGEDGLAGQLHARIADTPSKRHTGLRNEAVIADGEAMLFVYDGEESRAMTMEEMTVPLDIIYVSADGRITAIDEADPGDVVVEAPGKWVIEAKRGWCEQCDVSVGDRVNFPTTARVGKGRVYVDDPAEAPEGVDVREGPRGGLYYEESRENANDDEPSLDQHTEEPTVETVTPTPEEFAQNVARAIEENPEMGAFLTAHTPEELADHTLLGTPDGNAGVAVSPDGDIQNLFNFGGPKGAGRELIERAIDAGGRTLDCYNGFLRTLYKGYGFRETGRMTFDPEYAPDGWNFEEYGQPDVVFMHYDPEEAYTVSERYYEPNDWEQAKTDSRGAADFGRHEKGRERGVGRGARRTDSGAGSPRGRTVGKDRVYVDDPSEAPAGVDVQEGERGGTYYESEGRGESDESGASTPGATGNARLARSNFENVTSFTEWARANGAPRGMSAWNMEVAIGDDGTPQAFITHVGPEAEKVTEAERSMAAYQFFHNTGFGDMVPDYYYDAEAGYYSVEAVDGMPASEARDVSVDINEFLDFAAVNVLAGNIDAHDHNVYITPDGSLSAIDIDHSAGALDTEWEGKRAIGNLINTGHSIGLGNRVSKTDVKRRMKSIANRLIEDIDGALAGIEPSQHSGSVRHNYPENIKQNIDRFSSKPRVDPDGTARVKVDGEYVDVGAGATVRAYRDLVPTDIHIEGTTVDGVLYGQTEDGEHTRVLPRDVFEVYR